MNRVTKERINLDPNEFGDDSVKRKDSRREQALIVIPKEKKIKSQSKSKRLSKIRKRKIHRKVLPVLHGTGSHALANKNIEDSASLPVEHTRGEESQHEVEAQSERCPIQPTTASNHNVEESESSLTPSSSSSSGPQRLLRHLSRANSKGTKELRKICEEENSPTRETTSTSPSQKPILRFLSRSDIKDIAVDEKCSAEDSREDQKKKLKQKEKRKIALPKMLSLRRFFSSSKLVDIEDTCAQEEVQKKSATPDGITELITTTVTNNSKSVPPCLCPLERVSSDEDEGEGGGEGGGESTPVTPQPPEKKSFLAVLHSHGRDFISSSSLKKVVKNVYAVDETPPSSSLQTENEIDDAELSSRRKKSIVKHFYGAKAKHEAEQMHQVLEEKFQLMNHMQVVGTVEERENTDTEKRQAKLWGEGSVYDVVASQYDVTKADLNSSGPILYNQIRCNDRNSSSSSTRRLGGGSKCTDTDRSLFQDLSEDRMNGITDWEGCLDDARDELLNDDSVRLYHHM